MIYCHFWIFKKRKVQYPALCEKGISEVMPHMGGKEGAIEATNLHIFFIAPYLPLC